MKSHHVRTVGLSLLACIAGTLAITQNELAYFANTVDVQLTVESNFEVEFRSQITLVLSNEGAQSTVASDWELHVCFIRLLFPDDLPFNEESVLIGDTGLRVSHINGCLFKFFPDNSFQGIPAYTSLVLHLETADWYVSRTDFMPNWYIIDVASALDPVVLTSTAGETLSYVQDFTKEESWKRTTLDAFNPYTLEQRFDQYTTNSSATYTPSEEIVPKPWHIALDAEKPVEVTEQWKIKSTNELQFEAEYLAEKLGLTMAEEDDEINVISLMIAEPSQEFYSSNCIFSLEMYQIDVNPTAIAVLSHTSRGIFYGVQTLISLLHEDMATSEGFVYDCPRFGYRGMHSDVSRNFVSKEDVLTMLEVMAMYKMNKFHFHLTDDEAWRLEIPNLPELASIGSARCHDPSGDDCIGPQLGASPAGDGLGSGFYSVQDYREILQYAHERHIEVIPELDMPGHGHAAINAMLARYRRIIEDGGSDAEAEEYLLSDLVDTSQYLSVQMFTDNAINPCLMSTYRFVDEVIRGLIALHENIQPLTMFNFGGDEVPLSAWLGSPKCLELLGDDDVPEGRERDYIKGYFVHNIANISSQYGLHLYGWEDGFLHSEEGSANPYDPADLANDNLVAYAWNNVWEWGSGHRAYEFANMGYQVVLSHATNLYFDHPIEPDPEERGYYWATRYTDLYKAFKFNALDIYENIEIDRMGNPLERDELCGPANGNCPPLDRAENVIGMQGHIWTETVRTSEQFQTLIYPRMLSVAERAWHEADWELTGSEDVLLEDWERFKQVVGHKELQRLDSMGITYNIRPPGVRLHNDGVTMESLAELPGLNIALSDNDGTDWMQSEPGVTVLTPDQNYLIAVTNPSGERKSRVFGLRTGAVGSCPAHRSHIGQLLLLLITTLLFI